PLAETLAGQRVAPGELLVAAAGGGGGAAAAVGIAAGELSQVAAAGLVVASTSPVRAGAVAALSAKSAGTRLLAAGLLLTATLLGLSFAVATRLRTAVCLLRIGGLRAGARGLCLL